MSLKPSRGSGGTNATGTTGSRRTSVAWVILATAIPSFFLGTVWCTVMGMASCRTIDGSPRDESMLLQRLRELERHIQNDTPPGPPPLPHDLDILCRSHSGRALDNQAEHVAAAAAATNVFPPETVGRYAVAMARASKQDFTDHLDMGVPLDLPGDGSEEVLLLYSSARSLPLSIDIDTNGISSVSNLPAALENCEYVNIILTDHSRRNQCLAIVPQYESYHIQKWMRVDGHGKLDKTVPLRMVSRGQQSNGMDRFAPPNLKADTRKMWAMLQVYFESVDEVLEELEPILKAIAIHNTVIVMVCNFGQSELLINFVCSAQRQKLDISNIIVFTTDEETTDIARAIGLTAYFDKRNFGHIPTGAASRYGDAKFVAMMMAKVICVQLVSMLGFDFLFQDVDIVWFKNPLEYFHDRTIPAYKYDVFFQDDGGHSVRYAPYSANSGFYFVRYNPRTRHFLTSLLMAGDLILKTNSHQQALIATLNEHVSLFGLKAKVLSRDMEEFPGGFQFHMKSKRYMTDFYAGKVEPYIFHMSWTLNKSNKLLFFRQMGQWYVEDRCIEQKVSDIPGADATVRGSLVEPCCAAEALFSCHYRDKPSLKPCQKFPPIDKGKRSWW